jgi:hypothetical protein
MEIYVYVGGHRVNSNHLYTVLVENDAYLKDEDIAYSKATRRTFQLISSAIIAIKKGQDKELILENLFEKLTLQGNPKRLLITDNRLMGSKSRPFNGSLRSFYNQLKMLFEGHSLRLFVETRNPATFITSAYSEAILTSIDKNFENYLEDSKLNEFRWSGLIERLQGRGADKIPVTAWRMEDYPRTWRDIIGAFTGVSNNQEFISPQNIDDAGLNFAGAQLLYKYTKEYPDEPDEFINNAKEVFLSKFPNVPNEVANSSMPHEEIQALTDNYNDDWYYIDRMDNVETIEPRFAIDEL